LAVKLLMTGGKKQLAAEGNVRQLQTAFFHMPLAYGKIPNSA
jgi:hypothetical protein